MKNNIIQRIKITNPELQHKIRKAIEDKERLFSYDKDSLDRIKKALSAKA
ncbi:MAG: hypothetical protein ACRC3B_06555 [Bacteroidia bacterium]